MLRRAVLDNALAPRDYCDVDVLAREVERLFHTHWQLVGLRRDLPNHNDYRVVRVAERELVLQNFDGTLKAFANICPHRFNALRGTPAGNGPLRCQYHFWAFDADGLVTAIPNRGGQSIEECRALVQPLEQWNVELAGDLIFVQRAPKIDLKTSLGPLFAPLAEMSLGLEDEVGAITQEFAANWKVVIENTLESEHAISVHPETFATLVARPIEMVPHPSADPHIAFHTVTRPNRAVRKIEQQIEAMFERSVIPRAEGYSHTLLFPNVTIGTTENRQFAIIQYHPLAPDRTLSICRLFVSKIRDLTELEQSLLKVATAADVTFTTKLLDEDRAMCESVQRGLRNAPHDARGVLSQGEFLVKKFQQFYRARMHA